MDAITREILAFLRVLQPARFNEEKALQSLDLYRDGLLDSLSTLNLVHFLESKFQVSFGPFLVTRKNFSTLSAMRILVERVQNKEN